MEERICKYDTKPIPKEKRSDAVYCRPWCGWTDRNKKKAKENQGKKKLKYKFEKDYRIIRDLYERGIVVVSVKTLKEIGFDFNSYTRIGKVDYEKGTTEYELIDMVYVLTGDICKLKKIR